MLGTRLGKLDAAELAELSRRGRSSDPKRAAAVRFAKAVADNRGKVSDEDIAEIRAAGFSDGDIVAIAGLTAQFLFTNFLNNIAQVKLDFPADVPALRDTSAVQLRLNNGVPQAFRDQQAADGIGRQTLVDRAPCPVPPPSNATTLGEIRHVGRVGRRLGQLGRSAAQAVALPYRHIVRRAWWRESQGKRGDLGHVRPTGIPTDPSPGPGPAVRRRGSRKMPPRPRGDS